MDNPLSDLLDLLNAMDDAAARWSKAKYVLGLAASGDQAHWELKMREEREARNRYERARIVLRDAIERAL